MSYVFFFIACGNKEKGEIVYKAKVTGGLNELIIVAAKKQMNTALGDTIRAVFKQPTPGLYGFEPEFTLVPIPPQSIKSFLKTHRSILHITISDSAKNKIFIENEKWSYTQCYAHVDAQNDSIVAKLITENDESLRKYFKDGEYKRLGNLFKKHPDNKILELVKEKFGINLYTSTAYEVNKPVNAPENFIWISKEEQKTSQGIFVYSFDYEDTNNFSTSYLIKKRNTLLKEYIPGPKQNSYMTTETEIPITSGTIDFKGTYAVELNGYWETVGAFMGGPFHSLALLDKKNNRIIVLDTYVYGPEDSKRDLMTELKAIIYSISFS